VSRARLRFSPAQPTYHGSDARHKYHWTPELCLKKSPAEGPRILESDEPEKAIHERFVQRLEEALGKMQSAAECGRLKDETVANPRN
jgi:hypothetical protein